MKKTIFQYCSAFLLYGLVSYLFFGIFLLKNLKTGFAGGGSDPLSYIWCLYWFKFSLSRHINPFITNYVVNNGSGINLLWVGFFMPFIDFVSYPLTGTLGPVETFNLLMLLSPVISSFFAFLLIKYVTKSFFSGIIGGYVFGFSAPEINALMSGQLNFAVIFIIPLLALFLKIAFDKKYSIPKTALITAVLLTMQFLISLEIFATTSLFLFISFAVFYFFLKPLRKRIIRLAKGVLAGYIICSALISPFLYMLFSFKPPSGSLIVPINYSVDLMSFFIPGNYVLFLGRFFEFITRNFTDTGAAVGYIGLPFILIIYLFFKKEPAQAGRLPLNPESKKPLLALLIISAVFMLGPALHVDGIRIINFPWMVIQSLPLMKSALPIRLGAYMWLLIAIISGYYASIKKPASLLLLFAAIFFTLPNPMQSNAYSKIHIPQFFYKKVRRIIPENSTVFIFPHKDIMLYQIASGMYFKMPEGNTGTYPGSFVSLPLNKMTEKNDYGLIIPENFDVYLAMFHANYVIEVKPVDPGLKILTGKAGLKSIYNGKGVEVFKRPSNIQKKYSKFNGFTLARFKKFTKLEHFNALLNAAACMLKKKMPPENPLIAENNGCLSKRYGYETGYYDAHGGLLKTAGFKGKEVIQIGILGSIKNLTPIIRKYSNRAAVIYFPYPEIYDAKNKNNFGIFAVGFYIKLNYTVTNRNP